MERSSKMSNKKIVSTLERIFVLVRYFMWEKGKELGLTPVQIQILQHIAHLPERFRTVSYIAREYHLTPPTVSEAVSTLLRKKLISRIPDPNDRRVYYLSLTPRGKKVLEEISSWNRPFYEGVKDLPEEDKKGFFSFFAHLARNLYKMDSVQIIRLCFTCEHFKELVVGDSGGSRYRCALLNIDLDIENMRVDCPEYSTV